MKFSDVAHKFMWFRDEIGDLEVKSIIVPDDLPNTIEIYGVRKTKRIYVKMALNRSTLDLKEIGTEK